MHESRRSSTINPMSLVVVVVTLMAVGLVAVASATAPLDRPFFEGSMMRSLWGRQAMFVGVGLVLLLATGRWGSFLLARRGCRRGLPTALFVLTVLLLVAALVPGLVAVHRGSHRWLRFFPGGFAVGIQPSEFAKLALVGFLALLLAERDVDPRSFRRGFLPAALVMGLLVALVGKEDFGTAVLLGGVGFLTLFVAGCRLRHLTLLAGVGAGGLGVLLYTAPYRMTRLTSFLDIWADPQRHGYQPIQSLTTIASGGWLGTGLGGGIQKYGYLPDSHTDFIFSVICEETGVLGGMVVIALFGVLVWLGLRTMWSARTRFERLFAFGLTAMIGLQAAMHIAVATVMAPTTGISLPFISVGGSGLLTSCFVVGCLVAIASRAEAKEASSEGLSRRAIPSRESIEQREVIAW